MIRTIFPYCKHGDDWLFSFQDPRVFLWTVTGNLIRSILARVEAGNYIVNHNIESSLELADTVHQSFGSSSRACSWSS